MNANALVNALVYNNKFAGRKLNAEQLSAEHFDEWKTLINALRKEAYTVYAYCENNNMKVEESNADFTQIFNCMRVINDAIGEVNGFKLVSNMATAVLIVGYAGKRGIIKANELKFCEECIRNRKSELKKSKELNGVNPEYIASLEADIEKLEAQRDELIATADQKTKEPTMQNENAFRLEVENLYARSINEQKAKSYEQLLAEAEARRIERNKRAKERKQAKKENN